MQQKGSALNVSVKPSRSMKMQRRLTTSIRCRDIIGNLGQVDSPVRGSGAACRAGRQRAYPMEQPILDWAAEAAVRKRNRAPSRT
jgi:hypothetical protein